MRHLLSICVLIACSMCGLQPITAEQLTHHTFRYLRDSGYPQTFRTMVFSPDSAQLAVSLAGKVDFIDFLSFAPQYGSRAADDGYDARFDLNGNQSIDFLDFLELARQYGKGI